MGSAVRTKREDVSETRGRGRQQQKGSIHVKGKKRSTRRG